MGAGNLFGEVVDGQGGALAGVEVTVSGLTVAVNPQVRVTNEQGQVQFPNLPAGTYQLDAELDGFSLNQSQAEIGTGRNTMVDITMLPATD